MTLGLEVLNLFDTKDAEVTYFAESQLPREVSSIEDTNFHPLKPRQMRVSRRYGL